MFDTGYEQHGDYVRVDQVMVVCVYAANKDRAVYIKYLKNMRGNKKKHQIIL